MLDRDFEKKKVFLHRNAPYLAVLERLQQETFPTDDVNCKQVMYTALCDEVYHINLFM